MKQFFIIASLVVTIAFLSSCNKQDNPPSQQPSHDILDKTKQFNEIKAKAESGDAEAQYHLGEIYGDGLDAGKSGFVPLSAAKPWDRNWDESFKWTQKSAEQGNPQAQMSLGSKYYDGLGVKKDLTKALEWWRKAAEQGIAAAQFNLGIAYSTGKGVPINKAKALEWYQKSADQGDSSAQYNLGHLYYTGDGVPINKAKALEWFQKAADQGEAGSQYYLGIIFDEGDGIPKDEAVAFEWFTKAANQGDSYAQFELGNKYSSGSGVPKNDVMAAEWFQKSAAQGLPKAQFEISLRYRFGGGVTQNNLVAYAWFNLAAVNLAKAERSRSVYESVLTPAERIQGQALASNWKIGETFDPQKIGSASTSVPNGTLTKQGTGTAFFVSSNGHALTNFHVVNGCIELRASGRDGIAKVITSDTVNDLALLQLSSKSANFAKLNSAPTKMRQGEDVVVFGYPLEWALSSGGNLTPGIVSALTGLGNNTNQIQITAPIQPGSSGSPVMDRKGNVVGVVSMKLSDSKMIKATGSVAQNVNFAVSGQTVKSFLDANNVPYKTGGGLFSLDQSNADIGEDAKKWTLLLECWK